MRRLLSLAFTQVALAVLAALLLIPAGVLAEEQGCQPEGADFLIDMKAEIGIPFFVPFQEVPPSFEWDAWTWLLYFGPCCIRGYYVDPQDNGFPAGCCHPLGFPSPFEPPEHFCKCPHDLHSTGSDRIYGLPEKRSSYTDPLTGITYTVDDLIPVAEFGFIEEGVIVVLELQD